MKELTDLELCKRIAEIEGVGKIHFSDVEGYEHHLYIDDDEDKWAYYINPLVDDALCFQLMVKYDVIREWEPYDFIGWNYHSQKDKGCERITERTYFGKGEKTPDITPNRAICLAIIKAHSC